VVAVGFEVEQVVDDVGGGGAETKAEESYSGAGDEADSPGVGEEERKEDEGVFCPLVEADGFEPGFKWGDALVEGADRSDTGSAEGGAEAWAGVGDHGLAGVLEEREVGEGVADVGEVVAEAGLEGGEFVFAGKVEGTVGGEDASEEAEVGGDAVGGVGVGGGGEVDWAPGGALLFKILKEFAVIGEVGDVELDGVGEMAFEGGLALEEPAGEAQERCRVVAGYGEGGVVEGIRFDEGAVQVDAENWVEAERRGGADGGGGGRDRQKCPFLRLNI
jgi:hypothetical protein